MRRLSVVLLVLGVASAASGVTSVDLVINQLNGEPINPVTEITIAESDWIAFDIVLNSDEGKVFLTFDMIVSVDGPGTLDPYEYTIPPEWDPAKPIGHLGPHEIEPGKIYEFCEAQFDGGPTGVQLDHLLLHCDSPQGDVVVTIGPGTGCGGSVLLPDYSMPDAYGFITIHQIPEPTAVVLLGVGGLLFLRKRRR